ncbi:MAG: protein kinase [Thermoanaerobaculia bacterium]
MSLAAGSRLGSYEITAKLGEGGMGEVYRARDGKLERDVAIKVLPAGFTEDAERLARFEREAKLLAQLHHPHVASIFGLEESAGVRALVMELVEGPTLAERLAGGALPLEEALGIARQIAEALEEAHGKGIVHRDLKPQNVKAPVDGPVKVLDFGLAKALDPVGSASGSPSASQLAASPTLTLGATVQGVLLGTAAYMAPEQAKGAAVDKRADIWAFGVLLWEMLTGGRLFEGDSAAETLAGVLKTEIDLGALPEETPAAIRRLLRRCLERQPKNRLHDIADARIVLDEVLSGRSGEAAERAVAPEAAGAAWRRALPWALAVLALAVALAAWLTGGRSAPPAVLRVDVGAPAGTRFHFQGDFGAPAVLSPDGSTVAFGAVGEEKRTYLWVRSLVTGEARRLEGTAGAAAPFFAPDGSSVGFFADGKMQIVPVAGGGTPRRVADAPNGRGGAWLPDGTIVFAPDFRAPLYRIRSTGGKPEPLTAIDPQRHSSHRWPVAADGGEAVVYLAANHEGMKQSEVELRWVRLDGSDDHAVTPSRANGVVAGGHLLFLREGTLLAQPLDERRGVLTGEPFVLAQDPLFDASTWRATFTASATRLLYSPAGQASGSHLSLFDRAGRPLEDLTEDAFWGDVSLSPDGLRLVASRDQPADLWMLDLERHTTARFTFGEGDEWSAVWSPDGRWVYYAQTDPEGGPDRIVRRAANGGGAAEVVLESQPGVALVVTDVTPDGRILLVQTGEIPFVVHADLGWFDLENPAGIVPWLQEAAVERDGRFSPDGRWVVYDRDDGSGYQVYVRPWAGGEAQSGERWQLSTDGGFLPRWSADGSEIVYLEPSLNLSRVAVSEDGRGGLRFGPPESLFGTTLVADYPSFDLSPDGGTLVLNHFGEQQSEPLRLVLPWKP